MNKIQNKSASACLQKVFNPAVKTKYNLRNNDKKLYLYKPRTGHMKRTFAYNGFKVLMTFQVDWERREIFHFIIC